MRTTTLKIGTEKVESVLIAGGNGFKIYSPKGYEGWAVVVGRKVHLVPENHKKFKLVSQYVNLKYQPSDNQKIIMKQFSDFVGSFTETPSLPQDSI